MYDYFIKEIDDTLPPIEKFIPFLQLIESIGYTHSTKITRVLNTNDLDIVIFFKRDNLLHVFEPILKKLLNVSFKSIKKFNVSGSKLIIVLNILHL